MEDLLKVGDRVNLRMVITESWQSEAGMKNGIIKGITDYGDFKTYWIANDSKAGAIDYTRELSCGWYIDNNYIITKLNN